MPPAAAGRVVLDEPRRVELLRQVHARPHPLLRLGPVGGLAVRALRLEAPLLVEEDPREDRRVVEVAAHHAAEGRLPLLLHRLVGLAPAVRHVAHHEDAQPVGPVQLARQLHLDVGADRVQPEPARDQDLLAHGRVARPRVEALGVPALVERHLEVDRLAVQGDVRVAEPGQARDADRAQAEVRPRRGPRRPRPRGSRSPRRGRDPRATRGGGSPRAGASGAPRGRRPATSACASEGDGCAVQGDRARSTTAPCGAGSDSRTRTSTRFRSDARVELERVDVHRRPRLEVDGLPEAARLAVALLALELERVRRVVHAEDEPLVPARLRGLRQLQLERRVAALVASDRLPVEPAGSSSSRRRRPRGRPASPSSSPAPGPSARTTRRRPRPRPRRASSPRGTARGS